MSSTRLNYFPQAIYLHEHVVKNFDNQRYLRLCYNVVFSEIEIPFAVKIKSVMSLVFALSFFPKIVPPSLPRQSS